MQRDSVRLTVVDLFTIRKVYGSYQEATHLLGRTHVSPTRARWLRPHYIFFFSMRASERRKDARATPTVPVCLPVPPQSPSTHPHTTTVGIPTATDGPARHVRSFSSGTGAGWASRSCARWPGTAGATRSTWGSREVQLEHSRRRADREHQRQAREQAERRSEEAVRMAQEHYFPWRPEW